MKHIFILISLIFIVSGCVKTKPQQPERLPEEEIEAFRDAALKMSGYIVLEDSAYHLVISKEKAVELGVPGKYYDRMLQELAYTNYLVREEYNRKGIQIEMPDFRIDSAFIKRYGL